MFRPQTTKKLLDSLNICSTFMFIINHSEHENILELQSIYTVST